MWWICLVWWTLLVVIFGLDRQIPTVLAWSPKAALWTRRIQLQPTNTTNALLVIQEIRHSSMVALEEQEKPVMEALRVCGNCDRPDLAVDIYEQFPNSETCRTMTISVLGACQKLDQALALLHGDSPNIGSFNAAIAACGKAKDWKRALQVYHMTVERGITSTLTCNTLLTVLGQRRQGSVALEILTQMPCPPDRLTYQYAISALSRSGMTEQAYQILEQLIQQGQIAVTDRSYEMLMAAYSKVSDWEGVKQVQILRNPNFEPPNLSYKDIQQWTGLVKIGKGKDSYWELATIELPSSRIIVGVHPNRNAIQNGIQLLFYESGTEDHPQHRRKLGYLLMQNAEHQSCLLGMFLQGTRRGQGLSKVCMAFWFWLCLQAKVNPTTGNINKPLLALLLEEKFGMIPSDKGGVEMELSQDPKEPGTVLLYSPSRKNLRGVFSPWDQQHQNLRLLQRPPEPRGRKITVGTTFGVCQDYVQELQDRVQEILPESTIRCHMTTSQEFQSLFFGREDL